MTDRPSTDNPGTDTSAGSGWRASLDALPEAVAGRIAAARLQDDQLRPVLDWGADAGVLFAGSLADGTGGRNSDLDFVVLRDGPPHFTDLVAGRGFTAVELTRSTLIDRILAMRNGIEFDVWVIDRASFAPLRAALDSSFDATGRLVALPGLQYLETKLLTRLYNGTVVSGEPTVKRWRDELQVASLPALQIAGALVGALSFLEDAWSIGALHGGDRPEDSDPLGCVIAARTAAEHLLQAAFADRGVLTWDLRYARPHRDRLAAQGPVVAALGHLERLLLPTASTAPAAYAAQVLADIVDLTDVLGGQPADSAGRVALWYLIDFARERFALPLEISEEGLAIVAG